MRRKHGSSTGRRASTPASRLVVLAGAILIILLGAVTIRPPAPVAALESVVYDEMIRLTPRELPPSDVVIVDVDERSLQEAGQWPWPRYRIAELVERAASAGARNVALDFLFSEPDRLSLDEVSELYLRERDVRVDLTQVPTEARNNDETLARTLAGRNVVLSADLQFEETPSGAPAPCGKPLSVVLRALPGSEGAPPVPAASGVVCPIPELAEAAAFVAAADAMPDQDGKLRRTPLLLRVGEEWMPGLALAAFLAAEDAHQVTMKWSPAGVLEVRAGETTIPTDHQGNIVLPFRANPVERFEHISAVDLLEGRVPPERLQGKIVLVGASASGLQDLHPTPVMRACPGIDIHALAADAILRQDFIVEPGWSRSLQFFAVILAGLLVTGLVTWAPIVVSGGTTALLVAGVTSGSWLLFDRTGVYLSPLPVASILLAGFGFLTFIRLRYEEKRKELLRRSFERYVSSQIVDEIVKSSQPVKVTGERRNVTILMSDIRGFTPLSERMEPERLVAFLNSYFGAMIDIILANEGTLDKFMGDAVLALFGAPMPHSDDSLRAVRVALAMQEKLSDLNQHWTEEGEPAIRIGIGISTGEVVVGNIGSTRRLEYTAIGQDVN